MLLSASRRSDLPPMLQSDPLQGIVNQLQQAPVNRILKAFVHIFLRLNSLRPLARERSPA
jgi:hypothetical protein